MKQAVTMKDVLNKSCIELQLNASTKDEAIRKIVDLLGDNGMISSKEVFIRDVYARESQGSTGIGGGIAIPHGKSDAVLRTCAAICRTRHEIPWESLDGRPVRCIILFAVRSADKSMLVSLLSQIAAALCDDSVVDCLFTSDEPEKIIGALESFSEQQSVQGRH